MVYLEDFDEFQEAAKNLFVTSPLRTRFLSTYRHCDSKVVLKVTNDRVCLKYRSNQANDVKLVEKFSQSFARWMVTKKLDTLDEPDAELEDAKEAAKMPAAK